MKLRLMSAFSTRLFIGFLEFSINIFFFNALTFLRILFVFVYILAIFLFVMILTDHFLKVAVDVSE